MYKGLRLKVFVSSNGPRLLASLVLFAVPPTCGHTIIPVTAPFSQSFTFRQRLVLAVVPGFVWVLMWIFGPTWRFEIVAEEGATPFPWGKGAGAEIFCFWHQCVLPCTFYYRRTGASIIVSRSFDGELITRILELFGFKTSRGSSSRGAREGLLGLKDVIASRKPACFTADGPRGPIFQTKMGPVKLAQMTGARIGAFHLQPQHAWTMNSWDRFLVPKPFTRIAVAWSRWTVVPTDLPDEALEAKRQELNAAIERARHLALHHFGMDRE
jgi:lysophospholipid acyltransferase (LPLAT)-like uncharacterized protein